MKIAVTYESGMVFPHFGHAQAFKVYDVQDGEIKSGAGGTHTGQRPWGPGRFSGRAGGGHADLRRHWRRGHGQALAQAGRYEVPQAVLGRIRQDFACASADDGAAAQTLGDVWRRTGYLMDPHTAVAYRAACRICAARRHVWCLARQARINSRQLFWRPWGKPCQRTNSRPCMRLPR